LQQACVVAECDVGFLLMAHSEVMPPKRLR
jgi:hypothetical protein